MNFLDRINAVLNHERPDRVPFAFYSKLLPRGDFEREIRNRGVGLVVERCSTVFSKQPNVSIEGKEEEHLSTRIYHTPLGDVSTKLLTHLRGDVGGWWLSETTGGSWQKKWMIEDVNDYAPVIFIVEDTMFYPSNEDYYYLVRHLGKDGIPLGDGLRPPYDSSVDFFGVVKWSYEQTDHPDQFANLLRALERREERKLPLVMNSPMKLINVGSISGSYGPEKFEEYMLPFYKKYIPLLHEAGKICVLHAHNSNLRTFKDLIAQTGVDVVEAFTPPPIGDLSIAETRAVWGSETIVAVNFPETIFYQGKAKTKQYTIDLLKSDSSRDSLVILFTEMGASGIVDVERERIFKAGIRAIMDAIEEIG